MAKEPFRYVTVLETTWGALLLNQKRSPEPLLLCATFPSLNSHTASPRASPCSLQSKPFDNFPPRTPETALLLILMRVPPPSEMPEKRLVEPVKSRSM